MSQNIRFGVGCARIRYASTAAPCARFQNKISQMTANTAQFYNNQYQPSLAEGVITVKTKKTLPTHTQPKDTNRNKDSQLMVLTLWRHTTN